MTRIHYALKACLAALVLALLAGIAVTQVRPATRPAGSQRAPADGFVKKTYTYKTVGELKIQADVYCALAETPRPVVVNFHGGALITGNRRQLPGDVLRLCRTQGYALVSVDYRLAPEVKLPEIIADVKDAIAWVRREGPGLFAADPGRLAVVGGSAGGYLTMMTGICVEPRPSVLVSYCGYGDVDGPWYAQPSAHYRTKPLVAEDQARRGVGKEVLTGVDRNYPDRNARGRYYLFLRQNGLWTKEVTGFDPKTERGKLTPYCPVRNVTAKYPPIAILHGTKDTDVPYEKAVEMARELKRCGVAHELLTIPDGGHGVHDGDPEILAKSRSRALEFIKEHLK